MLKSKQQTAMKASESTPATERTVNVVKDENYKQYMLSLNETQKTSLSPF
jgi:hypothetical protein